MGSCLMSIKHDLLCHQKYNKEVTVISRKSYEQLTLFQPPSPDNCCTVPNIREMTKRSGKNGHFEKVIVRQNDQFGAILKCKNIRKTTLK